MKRRPKELPEPDSLTHAVELNEKLRLSSKANVNKTLDRAATREIIDVTHKAAVRLIASALDPEHKKPIVRKLTAEQLNGPTLTDEA